MSSTLAEKGPPRGFVRLLTKLPLVFYRLHLGFLMGGRFLMLEHRGRKSGRIRRTVLEVVEHDQASRTYVIASGWGASADWFLNLMASPDAFITVGIRRRPVRAVRLGAAEAERHLRNYAGHHPAAFKSLGRLMLGEHIDSLDERIAELVRCVPLVRLEPREA